MTRNLYRTEAGKLTEIISIDTSRFETCIVIRTGRVDASRSPRCLSPVTTGPSKWKGQGQSEEDDGRDWPRPHSSADFENMAKLCIPNIWQVLIMINAYKTYCKNEFLDNLKQEDSYLIDSLDLRSIWTVWKHMLLTIITIFCHVQPIERQITKKNDFVSKFSHVFLAIWYCR